MKVTVRSHRQIAYLIFLLLMTLVALVSIVGCGPQGSPGQQGQQGVGSSIKVDTALYCTNGGIRVTSYRDFDNDGIQDANDTVVSVSEVCNGLNGTNGVSPTIGVTVATIAQCSTGGYVFTATGSSPAIVCDGIQGVQGLQGIPGTAITPVKFCNTDTSTYPEYGLMIGTQLFAVYWGTAPYSGNNKTAFLTEIIPGNYTSTGGNGCSFTIH